MKKFKKLIPALCMLLISAVLMGTSTYAWFSMNTRVTATGMQVTAKSENQFLQIVAGEDSFADDQALISATAKNDKKAVRPVSAVKSFTTDSITKLDTDSASTVKFAEIKWVEAYSNDPTKSGRYGDYKEVASATSTDTSNVHTLVNSFKVRLNPKTGATSAQNLKVASVTITSTNETANDALLSAVKVLIVCGDNWAIWNNAGQVSYSQASSVIASEVTTAETTVTVYIFFDGEETVTTTNNAVKLGTDGYKVEFVLAID